MIKRLAHVCFIVRDLNASLEFYRDKLGFTEAFEAFKAIGVSGIECHYSEYAPDIRTRLAAIAADFGLIATGGSDYHGTYKPGLELGIGRGDLSVPDEAYEALLSARPEH